MEIKPWLQSKLARMHSTWTLGDSQFSEYFRALSQSRMRETSESLIHLDHVSSSIFYNLLEFSFHNKFEFPREELDTHIQAFLSKCLSVLADELNPNNCLSYLSLAQEICCAELKMTVFTYLSRNLLEMPHLIKCLNNEEKDEVIHLRIQGDQRLCSLRKENLTSWNDPETERARHIFTLKGSEDSGDWFVSSLPLTDFQFTMSLSHDVPLATSLGHCFYVLGSIQRTGEKLLLQYNTRQDSWCELLPTLTRADADLPALYFLGATDRLFVVGGNNSENVVTSFSLQSQRWGPVHRTEKVAFAGQGTVVGDQVLMPSIEHNVARMDLQTLSIGALPPLPISTRYESIFYLHF
ncbi:hypothetical protein GBF38_020395 [Nibea albiflora]|uniref:Uncharacterized protein n=1 Tax=Nibea albiflora TaxID=240163 RepID=A0ACB7FEC6_NIBAL|nr:hypothetical protein GBF38_020395 [Nibea albiflora]